MHLPELQAASAIRLVAMTLGCASLLSAPAGAAPALGVASVELIAPANVPLAQAARIVRAGREVSAAKVLAAGLQSGDQIFLKDIDAVVFVRMLATGRLFAVRRSRAAPSATIMPKPAGKGARVGAPAEATVPASAAPGVAPRLFATLSKAWSGLNAVGSALTYAAVGPKQGDDEYILTASRGAGPGATDLNCPNPTGKSNEPVRFRVPALNPFVNHLAAGDRPLLLQWRGGVEPYDVALTDSSHEKIGGVTGIRGTCSTTLPKVALRRGTIDLAITDGNGTRVVSRQIDVADAVPPIPAGLARAKMQNGARTLYYASWLTTVDNGAWTLVALQMVGALGCGAPGADEWLSRYGRSPCVAGPASGAQVPPGAKP